MTRMTTPSSNNISRRQVMAGLLGGVALLALPGHAFAMTTAQAERLIDRLVGEINTVINSGRSERAMIADFEQIFSRYADVSAIAQSALGVANRQATSAQRSAFITAFRGYISRKYGKRFREFIGGRIEVNAGRQIKSFYEVISTVYLRGEAPFEVRWHVSDRSGRDLFFNLIIEGVNMLATERTEIGAMLDRRRGNIDALIEDLKRAG